MALKRFVRVKVSLNEVELAHFRTKAKRLGKAVAEVIRDDALRPCALAVVDQAA